MTFLIPPFRLLVSTVQLSMICALFIASVTSCRPGQQANSRVKFTVANRNARNVALVVGSPNGLGGVPRDISNVSNMIRQNDLGYDVQVLENATKSQILGKATEISSQLSSDSTVFFYFSGHGAQSGELATQGYQPMTLREVANALSGRLNGGRFKRFIAVIDACFSGQSAVGSEAMFLSGKQQNFSVNGFLSGLTTKPASGLFGNWDGGAGQTVGGGSSGRTPFEQGLVLAAAQPTEESLDGGGGVGGIFTSSWLQAIQSGKSSTLQQILEQTKQLTVMNSSGAHTPVWKAMPEQMLQERFNRNDNSSNQPNSNNSMSNNVPNNNNGNSNTSNNNINDYPLPSPSSTPTPMPAPAPSTSPIPTPSMPPPNTPAPTPYPSNPMNNNGNNPPSNDGTSSNILIEFINMIFGDD